jgi:hypothetical protein
LKKDSLFESGAEKTGYTHIENWNSTVSLTLSKKSTQIG